MHHKSRGLATIARKGLTVFLAAILAVDGIPTAALAEALEGTDAVVGEALVEDETPDEELTQAQPSEAEVPDDANYQEEPPQEEATEPEQLDENAQPPAEAIDDEGTDEADVPDDVVEVADVEAEPVPQETEDEPVLTAQADESDFTPLALEEEVEGHPSDSGHEWRFVFTPEVDGQHSFLIRGDGSVMQGDVFPFSVSAYRDAAMTQRCPLEEMSCEFDMAPYCFNGLAGESVYLKIVWVCNPAPNLSFNFSVMEGRSLPAGSYNSVQVFYTGEPVELQDYLQIYDWDKPTDDPEAAFEEYALEYGTDYEITQYAMTNGTVLDGAPTDAGEYVVTIHGIGMYGGTRTVHLTIRDGNDLADARLQLPTSNFMFDGNAIELNEQVTDPYGTVLTRDVDYELEVSRGESTIVEDPEMGYYDSYFSFKPIDEMPSEVGVYRVCAVAAEEGAYREQTDYVQFYILESHEMMLGRQLSAPTTLSRVLGVFTAPQDGTYEFRSDNDVYVYSDSNLDSLVSDDACGGDVSCYLTEGQTVYVVYQAFERGDEEQYTATMCVSLAGGNDISASGYSCNFEGSDHVGTAGDPIILPPIQLSHYDEETGETVYLTQGVDFEVTGYQTHSYADLDGAPSEPGSYYAVIEGKGEYFGTRRLYFWVIDAMSLQNVTVNDERVFLASDVPAYPVVSVTDAMGNELFEGTDYVVEYGQYVDEYNDGMGNYAVLDQVPSDAGTYAYRVVPADGSSYIGESYWVAYCIAVPEDIVLGEATFVALNYEQQYGWIGRLLSPVNGTYDVSGFEGYDGIIHAYFAKLIDGELAQIGESFQGDSRIALDGLGDGEDVYLVVRISESGEFSSGDFDITVTYSDPNGISYSGDDGYYSCWIDGGTTFFYTGEPIEQPEVCVYHYDYESGDGYYLALDNDFDIAGYQDSEGNWVDGIPTEVGDYSIVVQGIGAYTGENRASFSIVSPRDLAYADIEGGTSYVATGNAVHPVKGVSDALGNELAEGTDYLVNYARLSYDADGNIESQDSLDSAPSDAGTYAYRVVAAAGSDCTGQSEWLPYYIVASEEITLGETHEVTLNPASPCWAGRLTPSVSGLYLFSIPEDFFDRIDATFMKLVNGELIEMSDVTRLGGLDFVASFETGDEVYVIVRNLYTQECVLDLAVTYNDPKDFSYRNVGEYYSCGFDDNSWRGVPTLPFTGNPIELPEVMVHLNRSDDRDMHDPGHWLSFALTPGEDFVIAGYQDANGNLLSTPPTDVGNYDVVIQGTGEYTGQLLAGFSIVDAKDLSHARIAVRPSTYDHTGEPVTPTVTVTDFVGKRLTEGVDYTLSFEVYDANWDCVPIDGAPSECGQYTVRAVAVSDGDYHGETESCGFDIIDMHDLESASLRISRSKYLVKEGAAADIDAVVTNYNGEVLTEGVDYELRFEHRVYVQDDGEWIDEPFDGVPSEPGTYTIQAVALEGGAYSGATNRETLHVFQTFTFSDGVSTQFGEHGWLQDVGVFTAPEDGDYSFELSEFWGEYPWASVTVYSDDHFGTAIRRWDTQSSPDSFLQTLKKGQTVYIELSTSEAESAPSFTVSYCDSYDITGPRWNFDVTVDGTFSVPAGKTVDASAICGRRTFGGQTIYLNPGTDFEVVGYEDWEGNALSSMPTAPGSYAAIIQGRGDYYGEVRAYFHIPGSADPHALDESFSIWCVGYDLEFGPMRRIYITDDMEFRAPVEVKDRNNDLLTEGVDYALEYVFEPGERGRVDVTVTATGMGTYQGSTYQRYTLASKLDFNDFFDYGYLDVAVGSRVDRCKPYGTQYVYTGKPVTPVLAFLGSGTKPKAGEDYTFQYYDSKGRVVQPTEPGEYVLYAKATDDGILQGSLIFRFEICKAKSLSQALNLSFNYAGTYQQLSNNTSSIAGTFEEIARVWWSLADGAKSLVENLDFVTTVVRDEVYKTITAFTFTGIGAYKGTVRAYVYTEESPEAVFTRLLNGGGYVLAIVTVDDEGNVQVPAVRASELTLGVDYEMTGIYDKNGNEVTAATPGTYVYIGVIGHGAYEGCTSSVPARVITGTGTLSLDKDFDVYVNNADYSGVSKVFVLASEEPQITLVARREVGGMLSGVRLEEGQGFTVSREEASDGSWHLTLTADGSQLVTGTKTAIVWPVEKFDVSNYAGYGTIRDQVSRAQSVRADSDEAIELSYVGIPFVPEVRYSSRSLGEMCEYDMALLNAAGNEVPAISAAGSYTLVLTGTGNWTGTVRVPLSVVEKTESVDLSTCDVTLGEISMVDGQAVPDVAVSFGGYAYTEGVDYTVTYGNNTEPGATAWVKVEPAEGSLFGGYVAKNYTVPGASAGTDLSAGSYVLALPKPVNGGWTDTISDNGHDFVNPSSDRIATQRLRAYPVGRNGLAEPEVQVVAADGTVLDASNYQVSYGNNTQEGVAFVKVTGVGDYTGTLSTNFLVLGEVSKIELTGEMVSQPEDVTYTGEAFEPAVTVTYEDNVLTQDVDYTVAYADNTNAGTATVTVEGMGDYVGTVVKTFAIAPKAVTVTASSLSKVYGEADPELTASVGGTLGDDAVEYTMSREPGEAAGTYAVTPTGDALQGNYAVTFVPGTLTITAKQLSESMLTKPADVTYNGEAQTPSLTMKDDTAALVAGTDYEVSYTDNTNAGPAGITVTGKGNYAGTLTTTFTINPRQAVVRVDGLAKEYGQSDPELTATVTGLVGDDAISYTLWREQGEAVGTYRIVADANYDQGNYLVTTVQGTLTITGRELTEGMLTAADQAYAGTALEPAKVTCDGTVLARGTDYDVEYRNNVNVGTATVTVTGKGNYAGTISTTFSITPKAVAVRAVDTSKVYGEDDPTVLPVVVDGVVAGDEGLVSYSVSREPGEDVGTYVISVEGEALQGNYVVVFLSGTFTVRARQVSGLSIAEVADQTYSGQSLEPKLEVKDGSAVLTEGTDYEVAYSDNVNVGTATATVTGKGNYAGTKAVTFEINAKAVSKLTVAAIGAKTYTGSAIKPAPTVKDGTKTLKSGTDYKVAYKNNTKVGTATVTITGLGNYKGTKQVTFKINAASVAKATVSAIANQKYDGNTKTPKPTVKVGSRTLKLNTDYTLAYKNNTKAGTATVTITGKGNYTGSKSVTFKIVVMAGTWKKSGSRWWYEWSDGNYPKSVFLDISGKTYRFDSSGWMLTGWQQISGKYYYFGSDGVMRKNTWAGNYWLGADGVMATNAWVDGGKYYVGADGAWVKGKTK